ncbi:MAG: rRNA pseudouridine synthase [Proteobacteria bacterium]|nr:rRNA pseudouridine synthase [Pseudomonadota bacterium]
MSDSERLGDDRRAAKPARNAAASAGPAPRRGLAREISRRGLCSRADAATAIRAGRVCVDGRCIRDPEHPCGAHARIEMDGYPVLPGERIYLALNKPRGLLTTARDEHGRDTIYALLADAGLPWLAPVGRLDKASEGLLLVTNDSAWAAALIDPARHVPKTYRVQVRGVPDAAALARMRTGITDNDEHLAVREVALLQSGGRTAWLECVLDEGRNRHLRRLFAALDFEVLRLLRVAIGPQVLGDLARGAWRRLDAREVAALAAAAGLTASRARVASSRLAGRKFPAAAVPARAPSSARRGAPGAR